MDGSNYSSAMSSTTVSNPTMAQASVLFGQSGVDASALIQLPQTMQLPTAQHYQHAVVMQQVQAKAMSAAELALKRAAEISKNILSSNTANTKSLQESKSRSASKSKSRSPSQSKSKSRSRSPPWSKSKSKSRSPSRSPIRYRRRRSVSPIRYRRDYYRPRNQYYGYRGNNYYRYHRGSYNDYSRYRHGRDQYHDRGDYSYHRRSRSRERRRSRTKSISPRSRGRKRSESISTSPMKKSPTPIFKKSHEPSVSPDAKRDSRSRDTSREYTSTEEAKRSIPSPKPRSRSLSQGKARRDHRSRQGDNLDEARRHELRKNQGEGRIQGSNFSTRSHSVSCDSQRQKNASQEEPNWSSGGEEVQRTNSPTGSLSISLDSKDPHSVPRNLSAKKSSSTNHSLLGEMYVEELGSGHKRKVTRTERHPGGRSRVRKHKLGSQAIDDDEVMEDWRDDLKVVARKKETSAQKEAKCGNSEERVKLVQGLSNPVDLTASNNNELKHASMSHSASSEVKSFSTLAPTEQDSFSEKGCKAVVECGKGHGFEVEVGGECSESERDAEEDAIYEGPIPANPACEELPPRFEGGTDTHAPVLGAQLLEPPNTMELSLSAPSKKDSGDLAGDTTAFSERQHNPEKTMDRRRSSNHEAESLKPEKHKVRHKKHRKKHSHGTADEDYPGNDGAELSKHGKDSHRSSKRHRKKQRHENMNEDDTNSDGARKRHKRKHKRDGERRHRDKKRKKHEHRTRSSSESTEDVSSTGEDEV